MAGRILTLRELNRATLARQHLLERASRTVPDMIEQLVGLQAQLPRAPYVGLWTRLHRFQRDDLANLIDNRTVIKATLMRSTLHLFTADDYLRLRETLQPVMTSAFESIAKRRDSRLDYDRIIAAARDFLAEQPRSFAEIADMLTALVPDGDPGAMRYAVRTHLPLVQVPTDTAWSYPGNPQFALAEDWLKQSIPTEDNLRTLVFRYLAAFGPATVTDLQTWSGLSKLKEVVVSLKPELRTYRDEKRRELFDVPDAPLPDADTPVPVRFLPEFDNLLLGHKDRTRVVADEYRSKVYLPGLRVSATILVDGFVQGVWKIERKKKAATLRIECFAPLTKPQQQALMDEAEALIRFVESDAETFAVEVEPPL